MGESEMCPLCGGEIISGECPSCGFVPPDCGVIAAPYDLDPSNDRFGESDPAEGMFPADMSEFTDLGNGYFEENRELEIPSIALPNLQSVGSLGFASANAKPAPKIVVMRSNPLPGSSLPFPKQTGSNAAPKRQPNQAPPPVQTFQPARNAQTAQTAQTVQAAQTANSQQSAAQSAPFVPYVQQVQQLQQASLPVRIVKGTSDFVIAHWWKFLLMAAAPTAGLIFMMYYIYRFRSDKHGGDILKAIMFGVLAAVMLINRWDPFGLDVILRELFDIVFGGRRRRRGYY